jgi:cell division ATPase FtsA
VIDMGGGTTSIAVFLEGHLVHVDVVPVGGFAVTNDIARMLAAPLAAAERIKTLYGAAMGEMDGGADVISVAQMGEDGDDAALRLPRSMLTRIIQARLEEIFGEVQTRLRASGFDVAAGRRAVLTGGACQLAGTRELAARILNKQVRIGRPGLCHRHRLDDGGRHHAARAFESKHRDQSRKRKERELAIAVDPQVALVIQQKNQANRLGLLAVPAKVIGSNRDVSASVRSLIEEYQAWRST